MRVDAACNPIVGRELMRITVYENPLERGDAICIIEDPRRPDKKRIESLEDTGFIIGDLAYELEQLSDDEEEDDED